MFRSDDLHNVGVDIKQPGVRVLTCQQQQQQFVEVVARHQSLAAGHDVTALPLSPFEGTYFAITTKSQVQGLQW